MRRPPPQLADELLHELRTRQIELEMQNEELRSAYAALEASRDRYLQLYDFAPVGYLTITGDGLITEANLTCGTLLGVEREKLIDRPFANYVKPEDGDHWYRHCLHTKQNYGKQNCELSLRRADGTTFEAHLDCLHIEDNATSAMRITLTDITERKQAGEAQRIAAAAFETQDGIMVTDAHKVILRANQAFSRITGYSSAEEAIGRSPSFLSSGRHSEDFYLALWAAVNDYGYWHGEIWDKRKNGEIFPLWLTLTAVTDAEGEITHFVGSFTDITVQKQAEKVFLEARQQLENQVANTNEELEKRKEEGTEINTALKVLLNHRETDKSDAQSALLYEIEETILPFLKKLKGASTGRRQSTRLISILETNLQHLVKSYGSATTLSAAFHQLTPVEIQVASLLKQGLSTKLIAATLNIAQGTVSIHRKHIRKKLGLEGKAANLHSYLKSLSE